MKKAVISLLVVVILAGAGFGGYYGYSEFFSPKARAAKKIEKAKENFRFDSDEMGLENLEEARELAKSVLKNNAKDAEAYFLLGQSDCLACVYGKCTKKDKQEARNSLETAYFFDNEGYADKIYDFYLDLASRYYRMGYSSTVAKGLEYEEMAIHFKKEKESMLVERWFHRGKDTLTRKKHLGQEFNARQFFEKCLEYEPGYADEVAQVWLTQGNEASDLDTKFSYWKLALRYCENCQKYEKAVIKNASQEYRSRQNKKKTWSRIYWLPSKVTKQIIQAAAE